MFNLASPKQLWVLADLGGTHARFAVVLDAETGLQYRLTLKVAEHANFIDALDSYRVYLAKQGIDGAIHALGLAVAAPVGESQFLQFTNNSWCLDLADLRQRYALQHLSVLNDFAALALSVPYLQPGQLRHWPGSPVMSAFRQADRLAVIGPGTGLGVASLYYHQRQWHALASEGGHSTLTPETDLECQLWQVLRRDYPALSAETVFAGAGLARLHGALAGLRGKPQLVGMTAAQVLEAASSDALCAETLDVYFNWLGSYLGNQILNLGARQGLFLAGGILPRCQSALFDSQLYQRLLNKPHMKAYLANVPVYLLTDTMTALQGMYQQLLQSQLTDF